MIAITVPIALIILVVFEGTTMKGKISYQPMTPNHCDTELCLLDTPKLVLEVYHKLGCGGGVCYRKCLWLLHLVFITISEY